jgi:hypothetical protein
MSEVSQEFIRRLQEMEIELVVGGNSPFSDDDFEDADNESRADSAVAPSIVTAQADSRPGQKVANLQAVSNEGTATVKTGVNDMADMTAEETAAADAKKKADEAADSDKTLKGIADAIKGMSSKVDAVCHRMDAMEGKGKEKDEKEKADAAEKVRADAAAEEERKKADSARSVDALLVQVEELRKRIPVALSDEDRGKFSGAQIRCEKVAQAFGDQAPRWLDGEGYDSYRGRLLSNYKVHSPTWKDFDFVTANAQTLNIAEAQVYADAMQIARNPVVEVGQPLRMTETPDDTGRKIRRFTGDPESCWGMFKAPSRLISGFQTKFN